MFPGAMTSLGKVCWIDSSGTKSFNEFGRLLRAVLTPLVSWRLELPHERGLRGRRSRNDLVIFWWRGRRRLGRRAQEAGPGVDWMGGRRGDGGAWLMARLGGRI